MLIDEIKKNYKSIKNMLIFNNAIYIMTTTQI